MGGCVCVEGVWGVVSVWGWVGSVWGCGEGVCVGGGGIDGICVWIFPQPASWKYVGYLIGFFVLGEFKPPCPGQ